ncbi:MAG: carboxypeptidase regulatory-like domain-containing protein [Terriglobia bacterium]
MKKRLLFCALVLVFAGLTTTLIWAQGQGTGSIEGSVTDQSGAVIPGVKIIIQNLGTNATRELLTDTAGHYRADLMPSGEYSVTATQSGFATVKIEKLSVFVGSLSSGDLHMAVAGSQQTVEVTAETPLADPERIALSSSVGERAIEDLPIDGRRWSNFVLLTPGVNPDGTFGLISYRGISGLYNNNTIDGADDNQAFFSEANGRTRTPYAVSQASVKEFQVGLSNYSAEFGRAAGGTVNAITKSGSNEFHGEGFYFLRDQSFIAMDPFIRAANKPKPPERRQQFGGSVGGPLIKDKLFFFGNYDEQLRNFPITTLPPGISQFSATSCATAPGCAATVAFLNSQVGTFPRQGNNYIFLTKFDWLVNKNNTLTGEYNFHKWHSPNGIQTAATVTVSPSANGSDDVRTDLFTARLTSVLSGSTVNEFRFQWGRDFEFEFPNAPGPSVSFTNGISFGMPNFLPRAAFPNEKKIQFADNYSFVHGNHSFKAGVDIVRYNELLINLFSGGGVYSYSSLTNLANDCPAQASGCVPLSSGATTGKHYTSFVQAFDLTGQSGKTAFSTTNYNFYFQDNWRVRSNFTMYLGVRYELQHLPQPGSANPLVPLTGQINQDTNNWAPRIGFSWDVSGTHRTVVRGGYGIYYGLTSSSQVSSALTNNGLIQASFTLTPTTAGAPVFPNVLSAPPTGAGSLTFNFFTSDFVRPIIHSADLAVEHEFGSGVTVSGTYLFSRGQRLPLFNDINLPVPTGTVSYKLPDGSAQGPFPLYLGPRPNSAVGAEIVAQSTVNTNYQGFVLAVNKRFSRGVQFQSNFTLSKAIDNGQNSTTFFSGFANPFDPNNMAAEKGLSSLDVRKRWVTSFLLSPSVNRLTDNGVAHALFNDWQFGGILTFADGHPITPTISGGISLTPSVSAAAGGPTSTGTTNGTNASLRVPFEAPGSFTSTGQATVDLRFARNFKITERAKFQFIWEGFNIFNRANFTAFTATQFRAGTQSLVGKNLTVNLLAPNATSPFLGPTAASSFFGGAREFQLGLKFIW